MLTWRSHTLKRLDTPAQGQMPFVNPLASVFTNESRYSDRFVDIRSCFSAQVTKAIDVVARGFMSHGVIEALASPRPAFDREFGLCERSKPMRMN